MPRPRKCRRVCGLPAVGCFIPAEGDVSGRETLIMTVEEYEAIRLIDLEGLDQEACAERMSVARTTAQRIYNDARRKLACFLVEGRILRIQGGDYTLREDFGCDGDCGRCVMKLAEPEAYAKNFMKLKESDGMKIAVASEGTQVSGHFGRCSSFTVVTAEGGKITGSESFPNPGHDHGLLSDFMRDHGVQVVISGGMGAGARNMLADMGVMAVTGAAGDVQTVVQAWLAGDLKSSDVAFDHHIGHEHGCSGNCGGH